ncbi:cytochrome P450 monooxygenase sdnE [Staphylotrichum tortipilum]|uniref:Cytochrome P450 monooxygenase sdnE n=1 Tax=Staphylotrichum tortipilum TaxID=2831512 RepID=A0AAN6MNL5_9PEZI|nr:cytochrome P450 monooxygenase sdnE [Staphylotrichum longicolle]
MEFSLAAFPLLILAAWLEGISWAQLGVLLVLATIVYNTLLAIYRVLLSPLANIPGPKVAAVTYLYEIYYDVWQGGQYFKRIAEMHEKYGPIVRINPDEVHFNDPEFIDVLFPGPARKTDKHSSLGRRTGTQDSIVATVDHDMHRKRRNTINGFFSIASIRRLEPIMQESMRKLLARMATAGETGEVLRMHFVFKACTSDIITKYAFGDSFHFLDEDDFATPYMEASDFFHLFNHAMCHFPIVGTLLAKAPVWAIKTFIPGLSDMWDKREMWLEQVERIKASPNPDRFKDTIFEGILSSKLPEEEKTNARLAHEAQLIVFAGQLLVHPDMYQRLREELIVAIPDPSQIPCYAQLETLPYLHAVMQEVIRLHPGVVSRLTRVSPTRPIEYIDQRHGKTYVLPPGTPTNMTCQIAHMNPKVFQDPYTFNPQRWIDNRRLDRAFIGFARGTRNCIGMNFARQEMYIILATILLRYDVYHGQEGPTLELYNTTRERDIDIVRDMIIPFPAKGSAGLQLRVRS